MSILTLPDSPPIPGSPTQEGRCLRIESGMGPRFLVNAWGAESVR